MATKKTAKKAVKKVATPKPVKKVATPKPVKKPAGVSTDKGSAIKFKSFSVTAVIPVQQYGNIQPKIEVEAPSYEEARDFVMPLIEELFKAYGEGKPSFLGKVIETEKTVNPIVPGTQTAPVASQAQDVPAPQATASSTTQAPQKAKSEPVMKAEKAISLAMSASAAELIQDQIVKSTKIAEEDKPDLITLVLKKRTEFK